MNHIHNFLAGTLFDITIESIRPGPIDDIAIAKCIYIINGQSVINEFYFFKVDGFIAGSYKDVCNFDFYLPQLSPIPDLDIINKVKFISYYRIVASMQGRLCSSRIVSFKKTSNDITCFQIGNFYYIPMEGMYDKVNACNNRHGGLKYGELHGYLIRLTGEELGFFKDKYHYGSRIGTKVCPGERNQTGLFIYNYDDIL